MAKCKYNGCNEDVRGKGKYCSPKCKQAAYRNKRNKPTVTKTEAALRLSPTKSVTDEALHKLADVMTPIPTVIPKIQNTPEFAIPNYGQPDCECRHCQTNRANGNKHIINHGAHKTVSQLACNELNRVALPGDPDYAGCVKELEPALAGQTQEIR